MEASKDSAHIVTDKVTASGGELVRSSLHHLSENLPVKSHSQCRHLCNCVATVDHVIAPVFAGLFPLWKIFGSLILGNVLHDVSNIPKVSPFGIVGRRLRCSCLVITLVSIAYCLVLSGLLSSLRSGSYLKVLLREDIGHWLVLIVVLRATVKELFHHIDKGAVMLSIDSGVFNDQAAIAMKRISDCFTVLQVIA